MKKHEQKHIASDAKQLQRWVLTFTERAHSYWQMGFEEAARRSRIAATALLLARETVERGVPSDRVQAELRALIASTTDDWR